MVEYPINPTPRRSGYREKGDLDAQGFGRWIPSAGGDATYTINRGTWTRIGRRIFFNGNIAVNVLGTGSASSISGLPFNSGPEDYVVDVRAISVATAIVSASGVISSGTNTISFFARIAANNDDALTNLLGDSRIVLVGGSYDMDT